MCLLSWHSFFTNKYSGEYEGNPHPYHAFEAEGGWCDEKAIELFQQFYQQENPNAPLTKRKRKRTSQEEVNEIGVVEEGDDQVNQEEEKEEEKETNTLLKKGPRT